MLNPKQFVTEILQMPLVGALVDWNRSSLCMDYIAERIPELEGD